LVSTTQADVCHGGNTKAGSAESSDFGARQAGSWQEMMKLTFSHAHMLVEPAHGVKWNWLYAQHVIAHSVPEAIPGPAALL